MRNSRNMPFQKIGLFEGFTICSAISKFGNQLYYFVIPLYIYQLTESGFAMGLGWALQTLPYLLTPWIGRLIDTLDRKNVYMVAEFLQFVLVLLIPLIIKFTGSGKLMVLYLFSALVQTAAVASNIVSDYSFIPQVRRTEDIKVWNSYFITINNTGRVTGPAMASVFIAWLGYVQTMYLNSLTFLFTIIFVLIFVPKSEQVLTKKVKILDGLKIILDNKDLKATVVAFLFLNLATGGLIVFYLFLMRAIGV